MKTPRVLASLLLLIACAPKSADTNGETGSSDGSDATSATAPTTTTTTTDPTAPTTPTTSSSAESSATATATSTTSTDTGNDTEGGGGLPGACAAICTHWDMCSPGSFGTVEECTMTCLAGTEVPSPCAMALAAQWNCVAKLSCEDSLKFLDGDTPLCAAEVGAAEQVCDDVGCGGEVGGGDDFCELEQDCGGKVQNYHCDVAANLCTCTENDVPGSQCAADGFCALDPDAQHAAITACCGWEWQVGP